MNKYLLFFRFTDFWRSFRYFSSIVISISFCHVECGDGRQPRILVDNFLIPRSKTRTCSTPRFHADTAEQCYYFFFRINTSLFKAKTTLLFLWIFTSNISPHFTEFWEGGGNKIKDYKRKVFTNCFVSEIHQIWRELLLLDSPNVHPQLKKIKERRQIPTVNNVLSLYSLNMPSLCEIKLKHCK